jgi:hypothetical protein
VISWISSGGGGGGGAGATGSTGPTGPGFVSISNYTANTHVMTATSANTATAQTNLTFDGSLLNVTGSITASGDITAYSDRRFKQNIVTIDNAIEKLKLLRGVYYNSIDGGPRKTGVVAQEVEDVFPEVVITDTSSDHVKSVAYGNIVGLLIEAVKTLNERIDMLEKS